MMSFFLSCFCTSRIIRGYFLLAACVLVLLGFDCGIIAAQTAGWNTPSSGYVYDSVNRNIRAVAGFIGSAVLGPDVADGIDWVSIAPNRKSALADINGSTVWISDLSVASASQTLDRIPVATQSLWASDSSQAIILTADAQLIWLTNLSTGPVALSTWKLSSYAAPDSTARSSLSSDRTIRIGLPRSEAVWNLLAADSTANQVLLGRRNGETWQIWIASSTAPPLNVPFSGQPVAAAFESAGGSILVADAAAHRIVRIQTPATTPVATTLLSSDVYVNDPSAIAISSDGNRLFIADYMGFTIRAFDLRTSDADNSLPSAPMAELAIGVAPVSLTVFGSDRFLINAASVSDRQPLFFLDTGTIPVVSFVPGEN